MLSPEEQGDPAQTRQQDHTCEHKRGGVAPGIIDPATNQRPHRRAETRREGMQAIAGATGRVRRQITDQGFLGVCPTFYTRGSSGICGPFSIPTVYLLYALLTIPLVYCYINSF